MTSPIVVPTSRRTFTMVCLLLAWLCFGAAALASVVASFHWNFGLLLALGLLFGTTAGIAERL